MLNIRNKWLAGESCVRVRGAHGIVRTGGLRFLQVFIFNQIIGLERCGRVWLAQHFQVADLRCLPLGCRSWFKVKLVLAAMTWLETGSLDIILSREVGCDIKNRARCRGGAQMRKLWLLSPVCFG